jgi:hypothetical protein
MTKNIYDIHADMIPLNKVIVITHPKKSGHAEIIVKYPKDGAGRLRVSLRDCFGDSCEFSNGSAGGYGYDKLTSAIVSLGVIDGHKLTDPCSTDDKSEKFLEAWHAAKDAAAKDAVKKRANKAGYGFANWSSVGGYCPTGRDGWQSCYRASGLDYLTAIGYKILTIG